MSKNVKLLEEFEYYLANQDELLKTYNGKYVVIKGHKVIGAYDGLEKAVKETEKTLPPGTFLVQKCTPGERDYTATFHSRVA